ncbi:MAG: NrfD/PsrC family molybdoenzyme membrane anchor subunit [Solidesulfovibrio sp.]|uniref:NrfD/PsrC family molybdoenzyme membrane anchor subunit n=1 Tax=Solidesulfovibrio sp. TaxID=2910990 RepID=UPI002B213F34|nr:NrfD/PsrC family molybdoenzyme membrane anchor subunit [Solidesulfovibrio sp.]MEA4854921.1 NrfD/PsrC family molybdoenzyme membrane anchor subunit [Solidesulfovibrio sp.]
MANTKLAKPLLVIAGLGLLAGLYGVFEALVYRTEPTGLGSYVPWGLGVALYLLFLGLSAGGLLVNCLVYILGKKELDRIAGVVTYATLITEVCAGIAIALDLGHWERMYRFFVSPSLTSPMFWMLVFFTAVLVVYAVKALAIIVGSQSLARLCSLVSIPVSLCFYATNGYFFSIITSHPAWSGAFTTIWFVLAALLSGGGLVTALAWFSQDESEVTLSLGRTVTVLLACFLIFEWLYFSAGYRGGRPDIATALTAMLTGRAAWSFWLLHVGLGLFLPLALLIVGRNSPSVVAWAGLLIVAGFLAYRYAFVVAPQSVPMLPGLDKAWQDPRLTLHYTPTLGEWLLTLWVFSLGLAGVVIGPRLFPRLFARPVWLQPLAR